MTVTFSAIDIGTRLEVRDVLARFCHALDRHMLKEWAALFTFDACVDAPRLGRFCGIEEVSKIPGLVRAQGGGSLRHFLHNVCIDRSENDRDLLVAAYCTVSDWSKKGNVIRCWDLSARLSYQRPRGWKIAELRLTAVCPEEAAPTGNCEPVEAI